MISAALVVEAVSAHLRRTGRIDWWQRTATLDMLEGLSSYDASDKFGPDASSLRERLNAEGWLSKRSSANIAMGYTNPLKSSLAHVTLLVRIGFRHPSRDSPNASYRQQGGTRLCGNISNWQAAPF
jgi:hypothetical protein